MSIAIKMTGLYIQSLLIPYGNLLRSGRSSFGFITMINYQHPHYILEFKNGFRYWHGSVFWQLKISVLLLKTESHCTSLTRWFLLISCYGAFPVFENLLRPFILYFFRKLIPNFCLFVGNVGKRTINENLDRFSCYP